MDNQNVKRCPDCQGIAIIFTGYGERSIPQNLPKSAPRTGNWHRFIATRYCPTCAASRKKEFNLQRQKAYRRSRREERRELHETIEKQDVALRRAEGIIEIYDETISELKSQVAQLKAKNRAAYRQEQKAPKRGLFGGWRR